MSQSNALVYSVRDTAQLLSVTPTTVYRLVSSGELPSMRIGTSIRIPADALSRWISEQAAGDDGPAAA